MLIARAGYANRYGFRELRTTVKRKYWIILIIIVALLSGICFQFKHAVDLSEKLPVKITPDNILYGKIRAYHPDIFYMKYQLKFATDNNIIEENSNHLDDPGIKNYFYYVKNGSKITIVENTILKNDSAQTYLKIAGQDGTNYIFTVSGDHSGSANYRDLIIKLYRLENSNFKLIFNKMERYSIDPGIDSYFFTERFKLLIYKILNFDGRY